MLAGSGSKQKKYISSPSCFQAPCSTPYWQILIWIHPSTTKLRTKKLEFETQQFTNQQEANGNRTGRRCIN
jgi:hypothetical protein